MSHEMLEAVKQLNVNVVIKTYIFGINVPQIGAFILKEQYSCVGFPFAYSYCPFLLKSSGKRM